MVDDRAFAWRARVIDPHRHDVDARVGVEVVAATTLERGRHGPMLTFVLRHGGIVSPRLVRWAIEVASRIHPSVLADGGEDVALPLHAIERDETVRARLHALLDEMCARGAELDPESHHTLVDVNEGRLVVEALVEERRLADDEPLAAQLSAFASLYGLPPAWRPEPAGAE